MSCKAGSRGSLRRFQWPKQKIVLICRTMKMHAARCFIALACLAAAAVAFANPVKSKIITGTDSPLVITVPDDHFLKIINFTQDGGTDRGVVQVTLQGDMENTGTAKVLTATRIDFSNGINLQNSPEISNQVTIAGPARVRVAPVTGATLFISYKKESNDGGGGGGGGGGSPTPLPISTPTPGVTPSPTLLPLPSATP
jgi:hypothetical protein